MVDRTQYRQQKTGQHETTLTRKEGENSGGLFFPGHRVLVLPSLLLSI
jgi:hypothetical protein